MAETTTATASQRWFTALRLRGEFRKLWVGNLVSAFGSSVTRLALPLTAALILHANAVQMGVLGAAATLPNLVFGLVAGVVVDRLPRRPLMIVSDLGQAVLLVTIPAAAILGLLTMTQLVVVAFLAALLGLLFDVSAISLVPTLLGRELLLDGNTALTMNGYIARIGGPSTAGLLIRIVSAPITILLDALSYVVSAICTMAVRVVEPPSTGERTPTAWWADLVEGVRVVLGDGILRSIVGASVLGTLAGAVQAPLLILFMVRQLALSAAAIGALLAVSGAASIPGSLLAKPLAAWFGQGRATASGTLLVSIGMVLIPLAHAPAALAVAMLVPAQLLVGLGLPIYAINQLTVRQATVPNHLLGRTNATRRFFMFAAAPVGSLLSGYLGQLAGLRVGLLVGAALMVLAVVWTVRSPLWALKQAV